MQRSGLGPALLSCRIDSKREQNSRETEAELWRKRQLHANRLPCSQLAHEQPRG